MGTNLMRILIVEYIVIALAFAYQRNWPKMLYFISAAMISVSVLMMK